jgi:hypothetical protein
MVRAILDGRKTQTRRIIKPQPIAVRDVDGPAICPMCHPPLQSFAMSCKLGKPGDQLWVRETWQSVKPFGHGYVLADPKEKDVEIHYRATADTCVPEMPWRPSIFMPRHASRITLEISEVRCERLNSISDDDAQAEGICLNRNDWWDCGNGLRGEESPMAAYRALWETINGPGSWTANPWVWVISFHNADAMASPPLTPQDNAQG